MPKAKGVDVRAELLRYYKCVALPLGLVQGLVWGLKLHMLFLMSKLAPYSIPHS